MQGENSTVKDDSQESEHAEEETPDIEQPAEVETEEDGDTECRQTSLVDEGLDLPVPDLTKDLSDKAALIQEQQTDDTFRGIREWATKGEKGYGFSDGVLIHESTSNNDD